MPKITLTQAAVQKLGMAITALFLVVAVAAPTINTNSLQAQIGAMSTDAEAGCHDAAGNTIPCDSKMDLAKAKEMIRVLESQGKDASHLRELLERTSSIMDGLDKAEMTNDKDEAKRLVDGLERDFKSTLNSARSKEGILNKVSVIDQRIEGLKKARRLAQSKLDELSQVKNEIASYNFTDAAGSRIQDRIQAFIEESDGANSDDIEEGISRLRQEAKQAFEDARREKFQKGMIPFADTDDNQWYTTFAAEAKERGLVQGTGSSNGTELNPGGNTNLAEAIMLFGRIVGIDESAVPSSEVGLRLPEWAQAAAGTLEAKGVDLDGIFGDKAADDNVSRSEVARMLAQILGLPKGDANFSDTNDASDSEKEAIGAVNGAGIMTGEGGTDRFNPRGPLNRAGLVKVLVEGLKFKE